VVECLVDGVCNPTGMVLLMSVRCCSSNTHVALFSAPYVKGRDGLECCQPGLPHTHTTPTALAGVGVVGVSVAGWRVCDWGGSSGVHVLPSLSPRVDHTPSSHLEQCCRTMQQCSPTTIGILTILPCCAVLCRAVLCRAVPCCITQGLAELRTVSGVGADLTLPIPLGSDGSDGSNSQPPPAASTLLNAGVGSQAGKLPELVIRGQFGSDPSTQGALQLTGVRALFNRSGGLDISLYSAGMVCADLLSRMQVRGRGQAGV